MDLRPYRKEDFVSLREMLSAEGYEDEEMAFHGNTTFVLADSEPRAFFTFRPGFQYPYLQHFCVGRAWRSNSLARALVRGMVKTAKLFGYRKIIIGAKKDVSVQRFIRYYFKVEPYAEREGSLFTLVEV